MTPIRWDLFESSDNSTHTSLGLYCPNWAYTSAQNLDDFHKKENNLWANRTLQQTLNMLPIPSGMVYLPMQLKNLLLLLFLL
jgi:hypothetical protein